MSFNRDESPVCFNPRLSQLLGVNEAILVQHVDYLTKQSQPAFQDKALPVVQRDGRKWVRVEPWMWLDRQSGMMRHLSESSFRRAMAELKKRNVLMVENTLNESPFDHSNWYAINDAGVDQLENEGQNESPEGDPEGEV